MSDSIHLPPPQKELTFPLMKALELRRTRRSWNDEGLTLREISNLLWAACGITLDETKKKQMQKNRAVGKAPGKGDADASFLKGSDCNL